MSLEPGSSLGPYRIVAPLGRGGMATVYRARDAALERDVALKVLPAEFLHDPSFATRFRKEARVAASLEHPHVVPVYAFGIDQGQPWMAMRLLAGGTLADRLRQGPLPPAATVRILAEVAAALDDAHARGVVHRDVKPANVLLDGAGHAYLADFGIARMLEGSSAATATGLVLGTPSYMAPEQAMGSKVDRLADIYALGVVAFECLTGRVPYGGTTPVAILMKHVSEPVPEPTPGEVPAALTPLLKRCLAKEPAERWPTAGAFATALSRETDRLAPVSREVGVPTLTSRIETAPSRPAAAPPEASRARSAAPWVGLAVGAAAVVAAVLFAIRPQAPPTADPPSPAPPAIDASPTTAPTPTPAATDPVPAVRPTPTLTQTPRAAVALPPPTPEAMPAPTLAPTPVPTPTPAAAIAVAPATEIARPAREGAGAASPRSGGRVRVYCEAKLEATLFRKTGEKDVSDSLKDLREAIAKRDGLDLVESRAEADAVVQVLERGRQPAVVGMRKVRVRVVVADASAEFLGQDSLTGFNTWQGAANGASKQVEAWLLRSRGERR